MIITFLFWLDPSAHAESKERKEYGDKVEKRLILENQIKHKEMEINNRIDDIKRAPNTNTVYGIQHSVEKNQGELTQLHRARNEAEENEEVARQNYERKKGRPVDPKKHEARIRKKLGLSR